MEDLEPIGNDVDNHMTLGASEETGNPTRGAVSSGLTSVEATPPEELLLEELHRRYDLQQTEIDTLDTKGGLIIAYLGALLAILVTLAPNVSRLVIFERDPRVTIAASVSLLMYAGGVTCSIVAISPRTFLFPVGIEKEEVESYLEKARVEVVLQLLQQYSAYTQENQTRISSKRRWFLWGLRFSLAFSLASICTVCLSQV